VAGFAHLYSHGVTKCKVLSELLGRPILSLQDFNCHSPKSFKHKTVSPCLATDMLTSVA